MPVTAENMLGVNIASATATSTSSSEKSSSNHFLGGGAKAGISIGVAVGAIAIIGILAFIYLMNKRTQEMSKILILCATLRVNFAVIITEYNFWQ
ncbi:hypothetical protein N7478_001103 [Penicillium angulare]|uniref:uncharacterized protein n=1 Tax=Penicillium angulare TaxID=116970 RepID=UPI0025425CF4|nr:uncharacterized protein N7478_001103 [Penicillium angulare]KAJ5291852.1 hypothetical protein N7478_001103 [Penicillium angulare]